MYAIFEADLGLRDILCLGNRENIHYFYSKKRFCFHKLKLSVVGKKSLDGVTSHLKIQFCILQKPLCFWRGVCTFLERWRELPGSYRNKPLCAECQEDCQIILFWCFGSSSTYMNISRTFAVLCRVRPMVHVARHSVSCGGTRRYYLGRACPIFAVRFLHILQQP